MDKFEKLCIKIIDRNGNVSIQDIKDCGYDEGFAVEAIVRMSQCKNDSLIANANQNLLKRGIHHENRVVRG